MANLLSNIDIIEGNDTYNVQLYDEGAQNKIGNLSSLETTNHDNLVSAINEVKSHADTNADNIGTLGETVDNISDTITGLSGDITSLNNKVGNLSNLDTEDKTNLVNAINEVLNRTSDDGYVTPQDYGAVGDGTTDDTTAVQSALNSGKNVRFLSDYAVTSVTYTGSEHLIDFNGYMLKGIGTSNYFVMVIQGAMYNVFKNVKISGNRSTTYYGCLQIVSTSERQAQYNLFDGMYLKECWHGLVWGAKESETSVENAQSETFVYGFRDRSVPIPFFGNQRNGYLTFLCGVFDTNSYETWTDARIDLDANVGVYNVVGKINLIGCEIACTTNVNHIGFKGADIHAYDSIIEICGTQAFIEGDFDLINFYNGYIGQDSKTPFIVNNDATGTANIKNGRFHYPNNGASSRSKALLYGYDAPNYHVNIEDVEFDNTTLSIDIFGNLDVRCKNFRLPYPNVCFNDNDASGLGQIDDGFDGVDYALENPDSLTISANQVCGHRGLGIQFGATNWESAYTQFIPIYGGMLYHDNHKGIGTGYGFIYIEFYDASGTAIGDGVLLQTIDTVGRNRASVRRAPSNARYCRLRFTNGTTANLYMTIGDIKLNIPIRPNIESLVAGT